MNPYILIGLGLLLPVAYTVGPSWVSYYIKLFLYYLSLLVISTLVSPFLLCKSTNVENMIRPAKLMAYISQFLGLHWNVVGIEKLNAMSGQSAVIVMNHQYSLDLFPLFVLWPLLKRMTVVAKESLKYLGPFGICAIKCGIVFINRKKGKQSHEIIQASLTNCKNTGTKIVIFPEGTRNHNRHKREMLPFKTGAFAAAIGSQLPIVPIVVSHYDFLDTNDKIFEPACIDIRVLDPIPTRGMSAKDVDTLTSLIRNRMLEVFCRDDDQSSANNETSDLNGQPNAARSL